MKFANIFLIGLYAFVSVMMIMATMQVINGLDLGSLIRYRPKSFSPLIPE